MLIGLFGTLINMSISTALVIIFILVVRKIFSKRLPAVFAYVLWGIVLLRFIIPVSVPALFSALSITGARSAPAGPGGLAATVRYLEPGEATDTLFYDNALLVWGIAAAIWLVGAIVLLLYGAAGYIQIHRKANTAFIIRDDEILDQCAQLAGLRKFPGLYYTSGFFSPAIIGVFRPRIILPDHLDRKNVPRLRHILIHECVHLKRGDHLSKALFSLVLCLHWFNPFAWLACMLFDRDVEASCDERSLKLLGEEQKTGYAQSLIEMSVVQNASFLRRSIAFSESSLHRRVMNIARYQPLSRFKQGVLLFLVLLIGLVTVTNPLHSPAIFNPRRHTVSDASQDRFSRLADELSVALSTGDFSNILALTGYSDSYYLSIYEQYSVEPIQVNSYKLYPQNDQLAYSYLTLENGKVYVAVIEGGVVKTLQPKAEFEAIQLVDRQDEAVQLVENLHRFGILNQIAEPATIPRPAVAMMCIDEVYHDKLKVGELAPGQIFLEPHEIAQAAYDYFGIEDFSYTFDPQIYDTASGKYIYDADRGGAYNVQITEVRHEKDSVYITAVVYNDPLHMMPESQILYTLQKRTG